MLKSTAQTRKLHGYGGSLSSPAPQTLGLPGFVVACLLGAALVASIGVRSGGSHSTCTGRRPPGAWKRREKPPVD
jgi:hypothetical protein